MMNKKILNFILTNKPGKDESFISFFEGFQENESNVKFQFVLSASDLLDILHNLKVGTRFRLLIHSGTNKAKIEKTKAGSIANPLKSDPIFKGCKFDFTTRTDEIFDSPTELLKKDKEGNTVHNANEIDNTIIDRMFIYELTDNTIKLVLPDGETKGNTNDGTVILTALADDELKPFRDELELKHNGSFEYCDYNEGAYKNKILFYSQNRMAGIDTAIFSSKIIEETNAKAIIMPGVCGGRKAEKVKLYDIIIPERALDIISGQYKNNLFVPYGYESKPDEDFIKYIKGVVSKSDFKLKNMYDLIPNDRYIRENEILKDLKFHFDVMASGPFVLKTDNFLESKSKEMNHKIKGFEMESYGLFRSAEILKKGTLSLLVKSVMDYTDSKKTDSFVNNSFDQESTPSEEAQSEVPKDENIKQMAAFMSSICVRALLPYISEYIKLKKL